MVVAHLGCPGRLAGKRRGRGPLLHVALRWRVKKQDMLFLPITLPDIDGFSKFFHQRSRQ